MNFLETKVYRETSIFYFNASFFWNSLIFQNIWTHWLEPENWLTVFFTTLSLPLRLASQGYIFLIFLNSLGFYLLECLLNFLWLAYSNMCGKNVSIYGVYILRKSLNLCFFIHVPVPHSKLVVEFFKNLFPPRQKGLEEAMISFVKIQSKNMKMTSNISLFPFGMIAIFLNVMTLQFCKQYQIVWY